MTKDSIAPETVPPVWPRPDRGATTAGNDKALPSQRRRDGSRWLSPLATSAALLALPLLALLLFTPPSAAIREHVNAAQTAVPTASKPELAASPQRPTKVKAGAVEAAPATSSGEPIPGGRIEGVVLGPDDKPVADATVGCERMETYVEKADTDHDGRFVLPVETDGCRGAARHPDFMRSETIGLVIGQQNVLKLRRGGGIEGSVVDDHGAAIPAFWLNVESYIPSEGDAPQFDRIYVGPTDGGEFTWRGLPAGRYQLAAWVVGRAPAMSATVEVKVGETTRGTKLTIAAGATLSAHVIDARTAAPIAHALVRLDTASVFPFPPTTDAAGNVSAQVPAGPLAVVIDATGYRTKKASLRGGAAGATLRESFALEPEAATP